MLRVRRHKGVVLYLGLAVAALLAAAIPVKGFQPNDNPEALASAKISFHHQSGHLTGSVKAGSDLAATIRSIGRAAGLDVQLQPGLGTVRHAVTLDGQTINEALRRLTSGQSYVIFLKPSKGPAPSGGKIWVLVEGSVFAVGTGKPLPAGRQNTPTPSRMPGADSERAVVVRDIINLSNKADAPSIERLSNLATKAPDPAIRRAALSALAGIARERGHNLFEFSGLRDPDASVRIEAARSLLRVDPHRAPDIIAAAAEREHDDTARDILERLANGETVDRITGAYMSRERYAK